MVQALQYKNWNYICVPVRCMIIRYIGATLLFFSCTLSIQAQTEFSARLFESRLHDKLRRIYSPGYTAQLSVGTIDRAGDIWFAFGLNLSYSRHMPKADTFYTEVNNGIRGYRSYSDFQLYQIALNARRDVALWRHLEFYGGLYATPSRFFCGVSCGNTRSAC